jgi:hypothetical protein
MQMAIVLACAALLVACAKKPTEATCGPMLDHYLELQIADKGPTERGLVAYTFATVRPQAIAKCVRDHTASNVACATAAPTEAGYLICLQ